MSEKKEMSFWGHIGELRGHLIRSLIAIVVAAIVVGLNVNWIMDNIFFGPTRNDFFTFRVVNHYSREILGHDSITLPDHFAVQQKKLFQQFNVMMSVSILAVIVTFFLAFSIFAELEVTAYFGRKKSCKFRAILIAKKVARVFEFIK